MLIDIQHYQYCRYLLFNSCKNIDEIQQLTKVLDDISNNLDNFGLVEPYEAIMSIEKYYYMSKLITFPEKTVVIDCGCNIGLQQILFNSCYEYIGIDCLDIFKKISQNAYFKNGLIQDILPKLNLPKDKTILGISNLCCSYFQGEALEIFKNKFNFLISI